MLKKKGAAVRVLMTRSAAEFVTPLTFQTLSQEKVLVDMFAETRDWMPEHIALAHWADVMLVAPATANIIGKAYAGIGDDLVSCALLSMECPIVFAPAMNERMYGNKIVQRNINDLRKKGRKFIEPGVGYLAEGYEGRGRLAEPGKIVDFVEKLL